MYKYFSGERTRRVRFDHEHPKYEDFIDLWDKCRTCYLGEEAVKKASQAYLPFLSGQESTEYYRYKSRAIFLNIVKRTVQGLVGAAIRKTPIIDVPVGLEPHIEDCDLLGTSITELIHDILEELLVTGRSTLVIDRMENSRTYLTQYNAESFMNWRMNQNVPTMAVFAEQLDVSMDGYDHHMKTQYRVYDFNEAGEVRVQIAMEKPPEEQKEDEDAFEVIYETVPTMKGDALRKLPIFTINSTGLGFDTMDSPPLLDLANLSLSHYRTSADLENGRHYTSLPQPWITGVDPDEYRHGIAVGGDTAWIIPNEMAKLGYLEFTGAGLGSLENALSEKEQMMAIAGARLLESKKGVESAEVSRIRQNIETSILSSIVINLQNGIEKALKYMAEWEGLNPDDVNVELNMDFVDVRIPHQEIIALVQSYQMGGISMDTLLHNLKQGEVIPADVSIEEERDKIELDHGTVEQPQQDRSEVLEDSPEEKVRKELSDSGRGD